MSKYAERDPATLEPHYSEHVNAMTAEKLHEKSAIAAELAYRDKRIAELEADLDRLRSENEALWERLKTAREAADEIAWAVRGISYVAGIGKLLDATELVSPETAWAKDAAAHVSARPDTTELVSPEAADRHTQKNAWRRVADELPPEGKGVLAYSHGVIDIEFRVGDEFTVFGVPVTHWMPVPERPREGERR